MANTDKAGCDLQSFVAIVDGGSVSIRPFALADEAVAVTVCADAADAADPLLAPPSSIRYPTINFPAKPSKLTHGWCLLNNAVQSVPAALTTMPAPPG